MPAILQVLTGKKAGTKYELITDEVRIGRHPDCEVPLDGNSVSRFHAHMTRDGQSYFIEDQKSRNGTLVNGKRIESRVKLNDNDRVKICETLFVYRSDSNVVDGVSGSTIDTPSIEDDRPSTVLSTFDAQSAGMFVSGVRPELKLKAIFEISQAIAQTLDMDQIFDKILECSFRVFPQADRGLVIQPDAAGRLVPRSSKQRREDEDTIRFSKTVVKRAMEERKAILSADASSDERFSLADSIADFRIRSVMCVPLLGVDQRPLGVIQLDTQSYNQRFSDDDLQVLTSVANQAAIAMENARLHEETLIQERMRRELSFAREVQQGFLPRIMPKVNGYEFWGFYEAAGLVGGDYYDFVSLPDGRQAVIVADVSGKGVPAALLMARFSSDAKVSLLTHPTDLGDAVGHLNRTLCDAGLDDRFVTMAVSVIDPVKHTVQVVNAGHMSPMVRHRNGTIEEPANIDGAACLPLGILPNVPYHFVEFSIEPGEDVVTYSDGINESMNIKDEQYTSERLKEKLLSVKSNSGKLGEALVADVRAFSTGRSQHDDMTLVIFSRLS